MTKWLAEADQRIITVTFLNQTSFFECTLRRSSDTL
jgi:hypothetical protein